MQAFLTERLHDATAYSRGFCMLNASRNTGLFAHAALQRARESARGRSSGGMVEPLRPARGAPLPGDSIFDDPKGDRAASIPVHAADLQPLSLSGDDVEDAFNLLRAIRSRGEEPSSNHLAQVFPWLPLFTKSPPLLRPTVPYPKSPTDSAGPEFAWQGRPGSRPGEPDGAWYNPRTGESIRPDLGHKPPEGPHYDWNFRGSGVKGYRWYPDGRLELKKADPPIDLDSEEWLDRAPEDPAFGSSGPRLRS